MSEHFNDLTPAEAERLAYLAEECGEVAQAVAKILRHGYDSYNPDAPEMGNNRVQLWKELRDVVKAVNLMANAGDIADPMDNVTLPSRTYCHHQDEQS